ncbi:MAG: LanC-like protein [Actinomycetota bacterium]|nr:LanC-like protein [Actinomycetota bacterium]
MLFDPHAHERLIEDAWDPDRVGAAIREIARDAEESFDDGWPTHPQDIVDEGDETRRFRTVYIGGAGVVQALDSLQRRGLVELRRDYVSYLECRYEPDFPDYDHERSLWNGETGVRLVLHRLSPSNENADRLAELIAANAHDERREVMWGSPGTMLAATAMHELTGEARWDDLWRESAAWLIDEWDPQTGLWTQHLNGSVVQYIGPAHGFAGCVLALSRDGDAEVHRRAVETTARYAVEEDGLANWLTRSSMESLRAHRDGSIRLQWCHGAPGVVASLARLAPDDDEHGRLLCAGGELTWRAGPLSKGANLCHGTAGNGYAFLALFERTGDELWLERARTFAMHSVAQVSRARTDFGRGRHTLWTGDPGTALYLADCLAGGGSVPLP